MRWLPENLPVPIGTPGLTAALILSLFTNAEGAFAETPKDTLVQAWQIDDLTTLDPADVSSFAGAEYGAQIYDRLITYPADNIENLRGHVAESWEIGEDGMTYRFKIREGITFHSGNPLTAEDVAWSLQRTVKLDKAPASILTQFGFTEQNMDTAIKAVDDYLLEITLDKAYAPTFFLYCLTTGVSSIIDRKLVMKHEKDGDMGHEWLKTSSAGSGPFKLRNWEPGESIVLDAYPAYWGGAPSIRRVFTRHVKEAATQALLLKKGDIDIARSLDVNQIGALDNSDDVEVTEAPKRGIWYLGLNQKNRNLAKPEVRQALKYLIDYKGLATTVLAGSGRVHQSFLPGGFLGAIDDKPFSYEPEKARALLEEAGLADGFKITMDTMNSSPALDIAQFIQASWAKSGIDLEILLKDNDDAFSRYRARVHDIYLGRWTPYFQDPHINADTFASNPDNSDESHNFGKLAWRNSWDIPEMTALTAAAVLENDLETRRTMYQELQREHQEISPFVIMFQDVDVIASRKGVDGVIWGPSFDDNKYWKTSKR